MPIPIVIHCRRFPPRKFHAITIFPFVIHNKGRLTESEIRHETIHIWQQASLLIIPFYLLYLLFWIANLIRYHDSMKAYREIPFERSAYSLEGQSDLTPRQACTDWLKHLSPKES